MEPTPIDVLLLFAVKEEMQHFSSSSIQGIKLQVGVLGMGQENTRRKMVKVFEKVKPRLVLTCGLAGGLGWDLPPGRVLFEGDTDGPIEELLLDAGARHGTFYCSQRVAVTASEKHMLYLDHRCDAVEMESGVVREMCREKGIPSITIRVISDAADEDLPLDFNQVMNERCELDFRQLAGYLVKSPARIPKLFIFQRRVNAVSKNLGRTLHRLLESPALPAALNQLTLTSSKPVQEPDYSGDDTPSTGSGDEPVSDFRDSDSGD